MDCKLCDSEVENSFGYESLVKVLKTELGLEFDVSEMEDSNVPGKVFLIAGNVVTESGPEFRDRVIPHLYSTKTKFSATGSQFKMSDFVIREGFVYLGTHPALYVVEVRG